MFPLYIQYNGKLHILVAVLVGEVLVLVPLILPDHHLVVELQGVILVSFLESAELPHPEEGCHLGIHLEQELPASSRGA